MWLLLYQTHHSFQHLLEAKCCSSLDHCPEGMTVPGAGHRALNINCLSSCSTGAQKDLGGRSGRGLNALTISYNLLQRLKAQPADFKVSRQGDMPTQALHPTRKVPGTKEPAKQANTTLSQPSVGLMKPPSASLAHQALRWLLESSGNCDLKRVVSKQ